MKIALAGPSVLIADPSPQQKAAITSWGLAKWDRKLQMISGQCSIALLDKLATICKLPPTAAACRSAMKLTEDAVDNERSRPTTSPKPSRYPVKADLYQHQIRAANMAGLIFGWYGPWKRWTAEHGNSGRAPRGFGLLFDMGTGKTLTSIAIMGAGWAAGEVSRVLIVSPASVSAVWPGELERYADFPFRATVMQGTKAKRLRALRSLAEETDEAVKVAVINYESVWRDDIFDEIKEFRPDMIICDESQRIKSHKAEQSKALHRLGDATPFKLILSGTPVQNAAADLWSQYRFLDPSIFGTSFYTFRNRYCVMGGFNRHQIIKYKHLDELVRKEHSIAYRVTKEEALDLPEQIFETRHVVLPESEIQLYARLKKESYLELENSGSVTAPTVLTKLLRLQQFTGGFLTNDNGVVEKVSEAKLKALEDLITDSVLTNGHKLVIFARFVPEIKAIMDLANSLFAHTRFYSESIWGDVPQSDRGQIVERFQADPDCVLFVGQIDTAGAGITLTAADTCVYYSTNFNYASYSQSLSRIHRIGQNNRCLYIHLVVDNTIDQHVLTALEKKQDLAHVVVDGWKQFFLQ